MHLRTVDAHRQRQALHQGQGTLDAGWAAQIGYQVVYIVSHKGRAASRQPTEKAFYMPPTKAADMASANSKKKPPTANAANGPVRGAGAACV